MDNKQLYYVSLETQTINEVPIPDGYSYEIFATPDEIKQIRLLFKTLENLSKDALKHLAVPFNEYSVDEDRESYSDYLLEIYELLYQLGTEQTKQNIEETGIPLNKR